MLQMLYDSVVASTIFDAVVCGGGRKKVANTKRLNKLTVKVGSVVHEELDSLETPIDNADHPLHSFVIEQRSTLSHRFINLKRFTEHHRKSFLLTS